MFEGKGAGAKKKRKKNSKQSTDMPSQVTEGLVSAPKQGKIILEESPATDG